LRNIIDKLAQFVARNGPDFENMTKQKQKNNPRFAFLFGGENYAYYAYKVNTEQASEPIVTCLNMNSTWNMPTIIIVIRKNQSRPTESAGPGQQIQQLQIQLQESENNLKLQYDSLMAQQQVSMTIFKKWIWR